MSKREPPPLRNPEPQKSDDGSIKKSYNPPIYEDTRPEPPPPPPPPSDTEKE